MNSGQTRINAVAITTSSREAIVWDITTGEKKRILSAEHAIGRVVVAGKHLIVASGATAACYRIDLD